MLQATLRDSIRFEGIGLHSGAPAKVEVRPAGPDAGIAFIRESIVIPALAEFVVDTSRATVLGRDGVSVSTTEHLLSALFASGVTNAQILVDGPEIPACDGSSAQFLDAIEGCGVAAQDRPREVLELDEPVWISAGERTIVALPSSDFCVRFVADFAQPIGAQYYAGVIEAQRYRNEIAAARTFAFLHEVEALWSRGLGRGGSLENALVFAPEGPLQPLRWQDEPVRHKVLDLIGDFALLGAWPRCEILAIKSGHELHASLTRALRARLRVPSQ